MLAGQQGDFVLLESSKMMADSSRSLLFSGPQQVLQCRQDNWQQFLVQCEQQLAAGNYLAGWIAYEFGLLLEAKLRPLLELPAETVLAELGVYDQPAIYDHQQGQWDQAPAMADSTDHGLATATHIRLSQSKEQYIDHICQVKEYIAAGDTYQVNYTLKLFFELSGQCRDFYCQLRANQGVGYGAFIRHGQHHILSFSPELFFQKEGNRCTVRPMKGTIRRGRTAAEDAELAHFLCTDAKNRSENVMIVDLLRNDLARLAGKGRVLTTSLFDVESYESLQQMTSTISAQLPDELSLTSLLTALFPCGSVTGAPKIRTMEIINELETSARGVYTGAIGYLAPNGDGCFNVPIRTIKLQGRAGEMGIGSGIVSDSEPLAEWQECQLKARFLPHCQRFELIETMLWQPDTGFWLLEEHLQRLLTSARHFHFTIDEQQLRLELDDLAASLDSSHCWRVRLLVDREGGLSLSKMVCAAPLATSLPEAAGLEAETMVGLACQRLSSQELFRYHKTTQRQHLDQAWQEAQDRGCLDLLFANERHELTEGAITNLFVRLGDTFYTPPVDCGLLPGVLRGHLLATENGLLQEKVLTLADLRQADVILLGNSVRGLLPVELIE